MAALAAGCSKDATTDPTVGPDGGSKVEITALFESVRTSLGDDGLEVLWSSGDRIGVYTDADNNVPFTLKPEYDGKREGRFEGTASEGAQVVAAYYPYDEAAGNDNTSATVTVDATQTQGADIADIADNDLAVATVDGNGSLIFRSKLAMLHFAFTNSASSEIGGKALESIRISVAGRDLAGRFTMALDDAGAALTAVGTQPSATLDFADGATVADDTEGWLMVNPAIEAGDPIKISVLADGVWYGYTAEAKQALAAGTRYNIAIDASKCEYALMAEWAYGGMNVINKFSNHSPAIDAAGNVYFTTENSTNLYKLSPEGKLLWAEDIGFTGAQNTSPSVEPDGSAIYAGGGGSGGGAYSAFNPDGSKKWTLTKDKFFSNGATPAPNFNQEAAAIGEKNIYIGNAGTTGSVLSVDKATGERIAYVSNATNGTGGPTGGVTSGMALSSEGVVAWFANFGMFAANKSLLDSPTQTHETYGAYVPFGVRYGYTWAWANSCSGVACTTIDGENCIASVGVEKTTGGSYNLHVIAAPAAAGLGTSGPGSSQSWKFDHKIESVKQQDQGGIVVGPEGEFIIALKNQNGDGGVYAVATDGKKAWQFKCGADVGGAPAVDNNGNIHVAADDGTYYVIRPDYATGECTVLASAKVYDLVREIGFDTGTATSARMWTSVMIGDDGMIYLGCEFRNNVSGLTDRHGVVVKLGYGGSTAPGNTPWPMKWADCRHSCVQKQLD